MARRRRPRWSRRCSTPAGFDPTVINGGIINAYGTNARLGAGDWMVVEADESDGTFLKLPADVAIVTNIDPEHLDHFETFDAIKDAFRAFVENIPFYGFAVMCLDHPIVQELVGRDRGPPRHHLRRKSAGRRAARSTSDSAGGVRRFNVIIRDRADGSATYLEDLVLPMPGASQRAERDGRDRGRARARHVGSSDP